jgi:hypothetical protein
MLQSAHPVENGKLATSATSQIFIININISFIYTIRKFKVTFYRLVVTEYTIN